jgi:hypothetical protein
MTTAPDPKEPTRSGAVASGAKCAEPNAFTGKRDAAPTWIASPGPATIAAKARTTLRREAMAKGKKRSEGVPAKRADRAQLTAEESLKRLQEFTKRKEHLVASIRKRKDRSVSA